MQGEKPKNLGFLVSRNIKAERVRQGMTQETLAKNTGFSVRFISRLETAPQNLRLDKVEVFAAALGVSANALLIDHEFKGVTTSIAEEFNQALCTLQSIFARCLG